MPPNESDQPLMAPARYVGEHPVRISRQHGPVHASDASAARLERRDGSLLRHSETLLLPAAEVYGQSYLYDPRGERDPLALGVGRCVLPEHAGLSPEELSAVGYEFQEGRSDFEPVQPFAEWLAARQRASTATSTETLGDTSAAAAPKGKRVASPSPSPSDVAAPAVHEEAN